MGRPGLSGQSLGLDGHGVALAVNGGRGRVVGTVLREVRHIDVVGQDRASRRGEALGIFDDVVNSSPSWPDFRKNFLLGTVPCAILLRRFAFAGHGYVERCPSWPKAEAFEAIFAG